MKVNKVVRKRVRITGRGVNLVGDTNAAIVVNAGQGERSVVYASSRQRIVQANVPRNGQDRPSGKAEDRR